MAAITLAAYIKANEGFRAKLYDDTRGIPSVGWGRDLRDQGITHAEAQLLFDNDLANATRGAIAALGVSSWSVLSGNRKYALIDMAFELGEYGLSEFFHMLSAIRVSDWATAYRACLDSEYARQVPDRANQNAQILLTGELPDAPDAGHTAEQTS